MKKLLCIILSVLFVLPPRPAFAWSEGGHHIFALMAFDLLNKDAQGKLVSILDKHPRFAEDFSPPAKLPNDEEVLRWRIGRAGYWPDVARSQPKYNRSTWHYELGPALILGDKANMKVPERPGTLPIVATLETQTLHIAQALTLCGKTLADAKRPESGRALALCRIAHLVADAHHPCHAGSRNQITLKLKGPSKSKTVTYLDSDNWNPDYLFYGSNGLAALTFCDVPIELE